MWFSVVDVLIFVFSWEGWVNVLFEVMVCGILVVVMWVNGMFEVVVSFEVGCLVDVCDVLYFKQVLFDFLYDYLDWVNVCWYVEQFFWDEML